jgi:glycosyltransferase involved in cell wall biosynthesis
MTDNKLKIAIVVPGRFQAFDIGRELINRGHRVKIFTNYPRWAARRFDVPPSAIEGFWVHGILSRLLWWLREKIGIGYPEAWLHKRFGIWASKKILKDEWDVIHCWSGASEEVLRVPKKTAPLRMLVRESAHIRVQADILEEEEKRVGAKIMRPSRWIIAREEAEYAMADYIRVVSKFAYDSFLKQGIDRNKLILLPSGVSIKDFKPDPGVIEKRCSRIMRGEKLRVLYVGAVSFQKGIFDMAFIIKNVPEGTFQFTLVGSVVREAKNFLVKHKRAIRFIPKQPQANLPEIYAESDIFLYPTIQDGYSYVLAQAQASALPVLTTTNCQGPDVVFDGRNGWVLNPRDPGQFTERLMWCDSHRKELARMVQYTYKNFKPTDWAEVAGNFAEVCEKLMGRV